MGVREVGGGIGGQARVVAAECGAQVTALDLTPAVCETNRVLTALVGLADRVTVVEGDATDLRFEDAAFDRVVSIHASMNIERKRSLYREVFRVLRPGGRFGFYRSEEHTSELQSLMRISYAVFCLKKKKIKQNRENVHCESMK